MTIIRQITVPVSKSANPCPCCDQYTCICQSTCTDLNIGGVSGDGAASSGGLIQCQCCMEDIWCITLTNILIPSGSTCTVRSDLAVLQTATLVRDSDRHKCRWNVTGSSVFAGLFKNTAGTGSGYFQGRAHTAFPTYWQTFIGSMVGVFTAGCGDGIVAYGGPNTPTPSPNRPGWFYDFNFDVVACGLNARVYYWDTTTQIHALLDMTFASGPCGMSMPSPRAGITLHYPEPVGTELTSLLSALGLGGLSSCTPCALMANEMNSWGISGCREHRDEILIRLRQAYQDLGWGHVLKAAGRWLRTPFKLNPKDPAPGLLDEAIRRTGRRKQAWPATGTP